MTREEFAEILCSGMILHAGVDVCEFVEQRRLRFPGEGPKREPIPVPRSLFIALLDTYQIGRLSAEGDPPPSSRIPNKGYKMGWKEMLLPNPGRAAAYYVFIQ